MAQSQRTLGQHLATRLTQIGCRQFFSVPGDYNLSLLDELGKEGNGLEPIWCCNELNAAYAADGAARIDGIGCVVVTFTVGGLSAINAVAGAYAEDYPVLCITGGPNSNDYINASTKIHHTIGDDTSFMQELECFRQVTCEQVVIRSLDTAHELIDKAIAAALHHSKPAYICVACNLSGLSHPSFARPPTPYVISPTLSNPDSLAAAITAAATFLNSKEKPVLVAGPLLRVAGACEAFMQLVDASGYGFAFLPAAKGLLPEDHPACMGTFWGAVSSPYCGEIVESADGYVFAGPVWNDYTSVGGTAAVAETKMIATAPYRVTIAGRDVYGCAHMKDFLLGLCAEIEHNSNALEIRARMMLPEPDIPTSPPNSPLLSKVLYKHLQQQLLTPDTIVVAETGDALFQCQKMRLPRGCGYNFSLQYGSIGWSVGATLGLAVAASKIDGGGRKRRVVACIGDGSFQMTCQEVSTMLRYNLNPVIVLLKNGRYTIESEIHEGPYNYIQKWNHVDLIKAFGGGDDNNTAFAVCVQTEEELMAALKEVVHGAAVDKLCFIEAVLHKDDCSKELLEWGNLVSRHNSRPPIV